MKDYPTLSPLEQEVANLRALVKWCAVHMKTQHQVTPVHRLMFTLWDRLPASPEKDLIERIYSQTPGT